MPVVLKDYIPVWEKLLPVQQEQLSAAAAKRIVRKETVIHSGSMDCTGLLIVEHGQLRAFILSDEGREITLYRLLDRDICLFSTSCIMRSIQFEVSKAEKDTEVWVIPSEVYKGIMEESAPLSNFMPASLAHGADHVGTAREVVTRMLRYFQSEGMVKLTRGTVIIQEERRLQELSNT